MFPKIPVPFVCLLIGLWFVASAAPALAGSAEDEVAEANALFFEAFSNQDTAAMAAAWSEGPAVRIIGPRATDITEGSEAVLAYWQTVFDRFQEISVSMPDPHVRAGSQVSWVVGIEVVEGIRANGDVVEFSVFGTNVFEKRDGKWVMVHHHASRLAE